MKASIESVVSAVLLVTATVAGMGRAAETIAPPPLQPPPKMAELGAESAKLPGGVRIAVAVPGESPVVEYAASMLETVLETRYGCTTQRVAAPHGGENAAAADIALAVSPDEARTPPQGFLLHLERTGKDGVRVRIRGADSAGVLYGVDAFLDLLEVYGPERLPAPSRIRDWPSIEERAWTGFVRDVSPNAMRMLDWCARHRLNAGYFELYADRGQTTPPTDVLPKLVKEAARRGIRLYGCVSNWRTNRYLKRPLCPSNPSDVALMEKQFESLAACSVAGLIFLFDDIRQDAIEHAEHCAACRERFGDLAGMQAFWVEQMKRVAARHGIDHLIMCPTPYYRGWQHTGGGKIDGVAYYARLGSACRRLGVRMYFCPYRAQAVTQAVAAGLFRFTWWYNGVYPFERSAGKGRVEPGVWCGLPQIDFGWYNTHWDATRGVVVDDDVTDAMRSLPARSSWAWQCSGGYVGWAQWGVYCWAPEKFDPEACRRWAIREVLGAAEPYLAWERVVRTWTARFASGGGAGGDRSESARQRFLDALAADIAVAESACQKTAEVGAHAQAPKEHVGSLVRKVSDTVAWLRRKLDEGRTNRGRVRLTHEKKRPSEDGTRIERTAVLSDFWTRYMLRYAVQGKPGAWHRCRWHFGSGLGMPAPSLRNWYDAGFIDVEIDGASLDRIKADMSTKDDAVLVTWNAPKARVDLRFRLRHDGGLDIAGTVTPKRTVRTTAVKLWCIPGAGWGEWKDMDKRIVTPRREVRHSRTVKLDLPDENRVLYLDATYDVPHEHAEGPCGLLFAPDEVEAATVHLTNYVVTTTLRLRPGVHRFRLTVWDFHGMKNAEVRRLRPSRPAAAQKE